MTRADRQTGFTILELLVVVVVVLILATLVLLTASSVQSKNRNASRQAELLTVQGRLEAFYAQSNHYPTLASLNDSDYRGKYLKKLTSQDLQDPQWKPSLGNCTVKDKSVVANKPSVGCYSYQPTAADGTVCDNVKIACAHYTLTGTLEGGEQYVKKSLN